MLPPQIFTRSTTPKLYLQLDLRRRAASSWALPHISIYLPYSCLDRFPQLQFQYKDPERGFDRRSVHGLVARLVTVKDPATATALEVSAGGRVSVIVAG